MVHGSATGVVQMRPSCEARGETRSEVHGRDPSVDALHHAAVGVTHHGGEIGRLHAAATEPLRVRATEIVRREASDSGASARGGEVATEVPSGAEEKDSPTVSVLHGRVRGLTEMLANPPKAAAVVELVPRRKAGDPP